MKNFNFKSFVSGMAVMALIFAAIFTVSAAVRTVNATIYFDDYKVTYEGKEIISKDPITNAVLEPLSYNGWIYMPVEHFGYGIGCDVVWDGATKTLAIKKPEAISLPAAAPTTSASSAATTTAATTTTTTTKAAATTAPTAATAATTTTAPRTASTTIPTIAATTVATATTTTTARATTVTATTTTTTTTTTLAPQTTYVITPTGDKYHYDNCRTVKTILQRLTKAQAEAKGYEPCGVCNPK